MKKFYAILCLTIASLTQLQAQAPQGFNYQATVRNSSGDLIVNTNVYFKFNIMQGSQTSLPVFTEIHYAPTDDLGQISLVIGQGTATEGTFSELDWSLGSYYLGIELDTGSGYVAMGTTQLLSVPYALYAENSGNSTPTTPNLEAVLAENNSANNQQIKDLQDPTDAQDAVTKAYVDNNLTTSPWYVNATNDSISYDKKVVIGSSINQNVPALNVYGTDTGPFSPTAAFIRSRYRNNVLLFETSELDNDFVGSIGLLEAAENNAWPNSFAIGINDGVSWFNPLRIYYDNKALRLGFGSDNYYDPNSFGESSLSLGYNSFANGNYSTALGVDNIASGLNSTALGINSQASAQGAIVLGVNSLASGANSTAIGLNSNALGSGATALGLNASATGDFSNAFGIDVEAQSFAETVVGRYNTRYEPIGGVDGYDLDDRMFVVGNGQSDNDRSDALIIKKSGDMSVEGNQIKNVADPTDAQDAVTLSLLQTKLDELIERIEVLESNTKYDCGLAYFEDFSSCDLNGYYAQGGNITSTNSSFDGCGVYMTHYAGQDPNNFYAVDKKFLYGVYELEAIADNGISDNIVRVLQQEELTGGYTFSFRPTSTDNPGWNVYNDGELVDSGDTFPVARGTWYNIKIEVLKSSLKIWINDVVLFETDSITPPSEIPGYFKVGVSYSGGFDNLKFTPDSSVCE